MERNKRWSKEEEQVLLDCIRECDNTSIGIQKAVIKLNRSYRACYDRYARYIPKDRRINTSGKHRTHMKWDKEKLNYLFDCVSKNPNNIGLVFEKVAEKYNITPRCVETNYYRFKKGHQIVFTTIGKKTQSPNTKNIPYDSSDKPKKHSIWSKLKKLLKLC